jgi:hypothetical protein
VDDWVIWIIIAAFYAPLHYLLPVLVLFVTGRESEDRRRQLIRRALIDSTWSLLLAFCLVIPLAEYGQLPLAMGVLLLSMGLPFVRILLSRRTLQGKTP